MLAGFDPRPDLQADSQLWMVLLTMTAAQYGNTSELYGNLKGIRCVGARLIRGGNGKYAIRPVIDPLGTVGFYPGEYEAMRDKYLQQYIGPIAELLQTMKKAAK